MVSRRELVDAMNGRVVGSGEETLVLAHGYGGDQSVWDDVLPELSSRCRVVVFDWCFAGAVKDTGVYVAGRYSSYDGFADDLICLLEELRVESTVFVGHSMSGIVGCIASLKRPQLFSRLLLVGSSPRLTNTEGYEGGFDMSQVQQIFSSIECSFEQWASSFAAMVVDFRHPDSVLKFANCIKSMRPEVALSVAKTVFLGDYRGILENVVTPCNIFQTASDIVVPTSVVNYMQAKIKGECEVDIIDTEGHFPQLTAHLQFVEAIHRILDH